MKKLVIAALILGGMSAKAQPAQASDWGCTVLLCLASATDPMQIPECASALLRIRPWRLPTCKAAKIPDFETVETGGQCPVGYTLGYDDLFLENEDFVFDENDEIDLIRRRVCVDPRRGRTAPVGNYDKGFTVSYTDHNGNPRIYSFKSAY